MGVVTFTSSICVRNFPMQYKYFYLFIAKLKGLRPKGETFHAQVLIEMKGETVALALCSLVSRMEVLGYSPPQV